MSDYVLKMNALRIAEAAAYGGLKGHVTFMLKCHRFGYENERMWVRLAECHDQAEAASKAVADHAFAMDEEPVE